MLRFDYSSGSNFIVWALDMDLESIDLLVNEIGTYRGARPVNLGGFFWPDPIRHLEVAASGPWTVRVESLDLARRLTNSLSGTTDDVVTLGATGVADFTYSGSGNYIVWAYSLDGDADLLVNEIGSYSGANIIPSWADYLDVVAIGNWTIDLR